jgi:hypothetical protein
MLVTSLRQDDLAMKLSILRLIQVLVKQFSEASSRIGSLVLLPRLDAMQSPKVNSTKSCNIQLHTLSYWLSTWYHGSVQLDASLDVMLADSTICLLENAPLLLWFRKSGRTARSTINSFHDRIHSGMCSLIRICTYRLQRYHYNPTVIGVGISILLRVPFENDDKLANEAVALVNALICLWRREEVDNAAQLGKALTKVMGGQLTPQGNLTTMSIPLRAWLRTGKGKTLVRNILTGSKPSKGKEEADFLQSVTRTLPVVILNKDDTIWRDYVRFVDVWDQFSSRRAAELVQSLLQGRNNFNIDTGVECTSDLLQDVVPRLRAWVVSSETGTRIAALTCYSLLDTPVWKELIVSGSLQRDLNLIYTSMRQEDGIGQKIRSEACKILGEVSTNLIPVIKETGDLATPLVQQICQQFVACLDDTSDNVVSMAVFGLGNLAQALIFVDMGVLPVESRYLLSAAVVSKLDAGDPKIASNAVRAAAWMICLLGRFRKEEDEQLFHDTLDKCLECISARIEQVQALERGELSHFSWKQRSTVKKLGWGACNALTIIFSKVKVSSADFWMERQRVVDCVKLLYICLENLPSANEKLVVTAMTALRSLDAKTLYQVIEDKANVITSFCILIGHLCSVADGRKESKLEREMGMTLAHLLDACTINDIRHVLEYCQINNYIGGLYEWAKEQALSADMWGKLALAAQQCTTLDVYWEQHFVNYARLLLFQPELSDEL